MRFPRLSIAGLMALTLIVALDCIGVGLMLADPWVVSDAQGGRSLDRGIQQRKEVATAVVPMATILAVVAVWGRRRPGRLGFLMAGGLALVVVGGVAALISDNYLMWNHYLIQPLLAPCEPALERWLKSLPTAFQSPVGFALFWVIVSGPTTLAQLGPALVGRWFDRRFEIRRRPQLEIAAVGTRVGDGQTVHSND